MEIGWHQLKYVQGAEVLQSSNLARSLIFPFLKYSIFFVFTRYSFFFALYPPLCFFSHWILCHVCFFSSSRQHLCLRSALMRRRAPCGPFCSPVQVSTSFYMRLHWANQQLSILPFRNESTVHWWILSIYRPSKINSSSFSDEHLLDNEAEYIHWLVWVHLKTRHGDQVAFTGRF